MNGVQRASLWAGSAATWVNLKPTGATRSQANGVHGGEQVGMASVGGIDRASLWNSSAASWVDLHAFVPGGISHSYAQGISGDANFTYVVGFGISGGGFRALLWTRTNPPACDPDITCDGNTDQEDVGCIITVVAGNPGCECQDADFNRDGNVDQEDVGAVINVVAGGGCP